MNDAGDMQLLNSYWLLLLRFHVIQNGIAAFRTGSRISVALNTSSKNNPFRTGLTFLPLSNKSESNMVFSKEDHQLFGKFRISSSQIFYRSEHSFAMVNLRPLVPGHVLVVSNRVVPLLSDLKCEFVYHIMHFCNVVLLIYATNINLSSMQAEENDDLWRSVRTVQSALKDQYNCDAFNVAVQDGMGAGQSVPHVHVHILPRFCGDFKRNDDIYDRLESWAPRDEMRMNKPKIEVPDDSDRRDRTMEEMAEESLIYRGLLGGTQSE